MSSTTPRAGIQAVHEQLASAHVEHDADAIADCYAPNAVIYDLAVEGNLAFVSALNRMRGRRSGENQDMWYRTTLCLRKAGGLESFPGKEPVGPVFLRVHVPDPTHPTVRTDRPADHVRRLR
jgi:ketosteroid isomerase-like protein